MSLLYKFVNSLIVNLKSPILLKIAKLRFMYILISLRMILKTHRQTRLTEFLTISSKICFTAPTIAKFSTTPMYNCQTIDTRKLALLIIFR